MKKSFDGPLLDQPPEIHCVDIDFTRAVGR